MPDISDMVFYQEGLGELPQWDTQLFRQVWPSFDSFYTDYRISPFVVKELDGKESLVYSLLFANYGNTPIANMDVDQFKARVFSTVFQFGPTWQKKLEIQQTLRDMTEDELRTGGRNISNFALNPNTTPSESSLDELTFVSQQTSRNHKRGKAEAYANLLTLLDEDITEQFLERFRPLFRRIVSPMTSAIYPNEED